METPIRFITNFKSSDGIDLGDKFITKDYLLSVYPHLVPHLITSSLFWQGAREYASDSYVRQSLSELSTSINWKQISNSKTGDDNFTFHSAAIKDDGTLWTWGDNNNSQLGYTGTNYFPPRQVGTSTDWQQVSCGQVHTMAVKNDGSLWGWGSGLFHRLGRNSTSTVLSPVQIGSSFDWKSVFCSWRSSFGIKKDGSLWSWGTNTNNMLASGSTSSTSTRTIPTQVGSDYDWKTLDLGYFSGYAIKNDGTLWGWGTNSSGTLGSDVLNIFSPTQFTTTNDWKSVSVGYRHVAAIKKDGRLYSRGNNSLGALGTGNTINSSSFIEVSNNGLWKYISCGYDLTVAIMVDGSLWAWGNNQDKQVTQDTVTAVLVPRLQSSSYNWKQCSAHPFAYGALSSYGYN